MAFKKTFTAHSGIPVRLAELKREHGIRCSAARSENMEFATQCNFPARYVTQAGDPVCGHHTRPKWPTRNPLQWELQRTEVERVINAIAEVS